MKKLNFVFITLLTCLFISCKPTVDSYPCEHCGILYFTEEEAEACPCERTCSKCGFVYDTPEEAKECSKHIGCPHGYLSEEARDHYINCNSLIPIMSSIVETKAQFLENAQNLYKEICDYVKTSNEFDDSYKCTLDFSTVNYIGSDYSQSEFLIVILKNNNQIMYYNGNITKYLPETSN